MSSQAPPIDFDDLPDGWVQQYDERSEHPFWVDTKATPPRSIWTHPYDDDEFLNNHTEFRDKLRQQMKAELTSDSPPPYPTSRRHSVSGAPSDAHDSLRKSSSPKIPIAGPSGSKDQGKDKQRGFFAKLKDKAIGTKEEREEARRQEAQMMQQMAEQRRQQLVQRQQAAELQRQQFAAQQTSSRGFNNDQYAYGPPAGSPGLYYGGGGFGRDRWDRHGHRGLRGRFDRFGGGGYQDQGYYDQGYYDDPYDRQRGRGGFGGGGFGGGGIGLPLLGGLAGGLLLGDILDGGGNGGFF